MDSGLIEKLKTLAARRKFDDLTISPVITWTSKQLSDQIEKLLKIPGSKLLFGGKPITGTKVPACYGLFECSAVYVPLKQILLEQNFELVSAEVFGPVQIVTSYDCPEFQTVLDIVEKIPHHLTAAIVSNDVNFLNKTLGHSINGTTYAGIRARTTGAPQNHWFGASGDPRCCGIGSPIAIVQTWSCHREIIMDVGPVSKDWKTPPPS